jgi:uncharacterized membrane protein
MFSKQDAAQAAGVSAPQKEKAPSAKTEGSKKNPHFIERLNRRIASLWWLDLCSMAVLLAFIVGIIVKQLTGGAV